MVQTIVDGFQHEQPDYWLNFGNPWELERFNVFYPIKFFGHVSVQEENGRQVFKWNPGETARPSPTDFPRFDPTLNPGEPERPCPSQILRGKKVSF